MARGITGDRGSDSSSAVVSPFGLQPWSGRLLPYEIDLARQIGLSEEEYLWFKEELIRNQKPRPAEYDCIPDIRCDPVTIIVSLVVGAALTAVGVMLAPKPKTPEQKEQQTLKLNDLTGPNRFNSTYGFDSNADLAQWGEVIPIPFGKFVDKAQLGLLSGGLLLTPKLVWSRLFSDGNGQRAKLLYSCGEYGLAIPAAKGTYLGDVALGTLYGNNYAVYYKRTSGNNRLLTTDLIQGTQGGPSTGDPETWTDIFSCPTLEGEEDEGFSYSYTPSQQTRFGIYQPQPNGQDMRVNWRVISLPDLDQDDDQERRPKMERRKVCGDSSRGNGMPGTGTGWCRFMGIYSVNGQTFSARTDVTVGIGSTFVYRITGDTDYASDGFLKTEESGVQSDDIYNTSVGERTSADEVMQLGETFQVGRLTCIVTNRSAPIWLPGVTQDITFEVIDQLGSPFVTACGSWMLNAGDIDGAKILNKGEDFTASNHIGLSATPVALQALGIVRNVRACDVVEIGIKSQVWQQVSGLCNFDELPTPRELHRLDEDGVTVGNGNMNLYIMRSSCFTIKCRPVGINPSNNQEWQWEPFNDQFVIRGRRPVDVYNYLRIYFPNIQSRYEFRFEPLPGANVIKNFSDTEVFYELDARHNEVVSKTVPTPYGTFRMRFNGRAVTQNALVGNPEMGQDLSGTSTQAGGDLSTAVAAAQYYSCGTYNPAHGKAHGWRNEVLGFAAQHKNVAFRSATISCATSTGGTIQLNVRCNLINSRTQASAPGYTPVLYTNWIYDAPQFTVISATGPVVAGMTFIHSVPITSDPSTGNNKWLAEAYSRGSRSVACHFILQSVGNITGGGESSNRYARAFSPSSQVADASYYPGLVRWSHDSGPEHEIVYVNEITDNETTPTYADMTMLGLSIRSGRNIKALNQLRAWVPGGIDVRRLYPEASHFDDRSDDIGRSNLFSDFLYFLLTDKNAGAGDKINEELLDIDSFRETGKFLSVNRIFCDMVLQEPVNIRTWASSMAPLMLCNFVMKAGQFAIVPAVPVTSAGAINWQQPVDIKAIFTSGNIIEDTFNLDYLPAEEREDFKAVVTYRTVKPYALPEELSVIVRYAESPGYGNRTGQLPIERFSMTEWCTQEDQAVLAAKYMLALRRHVTHTVTFKTSPEGLSLAPGDYIRVVTESNPFSPASVGVVDARGAVLSAVPIPDGDYPISYYRAGSTANAMETGKLRVREGTVSAENYRGIVFSLSDPTNTSGVYFVERLTIDEEMMVEITASDFPCDDQLRSLIAYDIVQADNSSLWAISK